MNKPVSIAMKIIYALAIIFFLAAFLSTLLDFSSLVRLNRDVLLMALRAVASIGMAVGIGAIAWAMRSSRSYIWILLGLATVVRLAWVLSMPTTISSDFAEMYAAARQAASGDFSFSSNSYFSAWVYQIGFTMYEAGIIKLFGDHVLLLKILNIIYSSGTVFLIYGIARKFHELAGRMAALLYAIYPPAIVMCSVLTNEHMAIFFLYAGLYVMIEYGIIKPRVWLYAGILLAIGDMMRPIGSVVLVSIGCYVALLLMIEKVHRKAMVSRLLAIVIVFFAMHNLVSYSLQFAGVTKYPLTSREPYWKFVVGLNVKTNGQYSAEDEKYVAQYPIGPERNAAEWQIISQRLTDQTQVARLLVEKFKILWGGNDASLYWSMEGLNYPKLKDWLFTYERLLYSSILLFAGIGSFAARRRNRIDPVLMLVFLILGYAAIHLSIEIQTRYRSFLLPSFAILFGYGLSYMQEKWLPYHRNTP